MTVREVLEAATELARESGSEATSWDARLLLAHVLGCSPLGVDPHRELEPREAARFERLWGERTGGVPVQHLLGEWDFFGRTFHVDGRALVPRPETEVLAAALLREAPRARILLDAGTGSGILAITFLLERPGSRAVAVDISLEALALARENAVLHAVGGRLRLLGSDWDSALGAVRFDAAVSNPPYLALSEASSLPVTVRDHDPAAALIAGKDALAAIRRLLEDLPARLEADSPFLFEIGLGQADAVEREVRARPFWRLVAIQPDLAGIPRVAVLRRAPRERLPE